MTSTENDPALDVVPEWLPGRLARERGAAIKTGETLAAQERAAAGRVQENAQHIVALEQALEILPKYVGRPWPEVMAELEENDRRTEAELAEALEAKQGATERVRDLEGTLRWLKSQAHDGTGGGR